MSPPRRPFGPNPPGRIPATMIRVLAAEISDSGRLTRGKRYWHDDAVTDITIGHGVVSATIQGNRPTPYVATLRATPGDGVPRRAELSVGCSCPDDAGIGACKHVVAAMFALSDEVAIEPTVLDEWRSGHRGAPTESRHDPRGDNIVDLAAARRERRHVTATTPVAPPPEPRPDPSVDEIARLLAAPSDPPELPAPTPLDHPPLGDELVDGVLRDALGELTLRWE